jgi:RpiR family transcriptional regulator, carbohydrate utilization regulator
MVRKPNELPLLERLTNHSEHLRPSELKVARAVLADPAAAVRVNMAALAASAGVSEPTVMRFCNGLGFDGFQSFRFALAEALAIGIPVTHSAISVNDSVAEMAMKIFDHTLSSLDRARRLLDTEAVATAVDVLLEASQVVLVGLGASGIIAQDALQQAVLLGVPCAAPIDLHQQFMAASMLQPGSVLVAISNTGRSRSILEITVQAKSRGATIIGVVGEPSPLLDLADVGIVLRTFEDTNTYTPTVSRLAGLVLVDVLATAVAVRRGPGHLERLQEMKVALSEFRGSFEPTGADGAPDSALAARRPAPPAADGDASRVAPDPAASLAAPQ